MLYIQQIQEISESTGFDSTMTLEDLHSLADLIVQGQVTAEY